MRLLLLLLLFFIVSTWSTFMSGCHHTIQQEEALKKRKQVRKECQKKFPILKFPKQGPMCEDVVISKVPSTEIELRQEKCVQYFSQKPNFEHIVEMDVYGICMNVSIETIRLPWENVTLENY
ncbi:unnamed protein product [Caenorhabditis angaria]|uniref:DUF19 domain-containing protein n=1 Tax=Caenorhabditis angaria TaxID=860376 RepID=A0A9P1ID08_9PELO|nr:unnamed protein product [Caenorhabditis angaria]